MHPQPAGRYCDVRETETKGLGLFAKVDIPQGTLISDEEGIRICMGKYRFCAATWENPSFWEDFGNIATDVEQAMVDLFRCDEDDAFQNELFSHLLNSVSASSSPGGILTKNAQLMLKNCLPNKTGSDTFWIIFGPKTCTINHSCIPNVSFIGYAVENEWNKLRCEVRTLKEIEADSEITLSYKVFHLPTAERRARIREVFGFDCVCDICTDGSAKMRESNLRLQVLFSLVEVGPDHEIKRRAPWRFFRAAYQLLDEYLGLGIHDFRVPHLWQHCALVAAYHSDAIRKHCCYRYAAAYWRNAHPPKVLRCNEFALAPQTSPGWGHTKMGLSQMNEVELFTSQEALLPDRLLMVGHAEDSYDRIMPEREAEQKRQLDEKATLAEKAKLADEAAKQLLAEEEIGKGKKSTAAPAQKSKKKKTRKRKEKKAVPSRQTEMEDARGPASATPELRLNTTEEEQEEVAGWEVVGRKKGSQQQA